jgi:hypothetical protein
MMCDEHDLTSQKSMESLETKVSKITVQRTEEIFPAEKEPLVSSVVWCLYVQKWLLPTFHWICMSKETRYVVTSMHYV